MARKLAERDATDIAAPLKLGDIFRDRIVEAQFVPLDPLGQQYRGEKLPTEARLKMASDETRRPASRSAKPKSRNVVRP